MEGKKSKLSETVLVKFHKTLSRSSTFTTLILVRFYETNCTQTMQLDDGIFKRPIFVEMSPYTICCEGVPMVRPWETWAATSKVPAMDKGKEGREEKKTS